ncbi:MAG: ferrochelatase [bacterium]|nr:ferrochelatase [bacterium]
MSTSSTKCCAILLAMGGPDSTAGVQQYLYNIFSDRSIIRLPGGAILQKPFAAMISRLRKKKVQHHYDLIGGGSPLLRWTDAQRALLEEIIQQEQPQFRAYVAMRYYHPYTDAVIRQAYTDGFRRFCFIPMYPQYCKATTGSSFEVAANSLTSLTGVQSVFVKDFHDDRSYIELLRRYIAENIRSGETLLFSAHSIPQTFVDEGDPYVDQIRRTAALAANGREYFVSFQSRTGPVQWVGPDTIVETKRLLAERTGGLFIVPIAFVCDHIETLYEIDIELAGMLDSSDAARIRRMPMFNDDPAFAEMLAGIVRERMTHHAAV